MKKILSVLLAVIMLGSINLFSGCNKNDNQDLLDRIAALEKQLADSDTSALLDRIADLEKQLEDAINGGSDSELASDVATLKTTVAELKATITSLTTTVNTLSDTIDTLTEVINGSESGNAALKVKIDELTKTILELTTKVTKLTDKMTVAEARILVLEGIASGENEPHIYEVGVAGNDTFTFVNNGIKLFSVRLISYGPRLVSNYMDAEIVNINMPNIGLNNYFEAMLYNEISNTTFTSEGQIKTAIPISEMPTQFTCLFNSRPDVSLVTHIYIGIPNQNSTGSLIPYAIFKLPASPTL